MNSYQKFYTDLAGNLKDLSYLYEKIVAWLKENYRGNTLVFYRPDPLEDLPLGAGLMTTAINLHDKEEPEPIAAEKMEENEVGLLDLDNKLIHLTDKQLWLGALETDTPLPEEISRDIKLISTLLGQAVELQRQNIQATISRWFQNISENLNSPESYNNILEYLVEEACDLVGANSGGYYTQAGDDYRIEVAYGFETEVEREKRTITHEKLIQFDFNRAELVVEVPGEQKETSNIYIPIQSFRRRAGVLAIYNWESKQKLSQRKRYLLSMLSELGHFALCQYQMQTRQTKIIQDGLTGLKTGVYFRQRLNQEIERGRRYNCQNALILLDIDNFSELNETYGRNAGDTVLREFGRLIKNCFRGVDISSRFSDDRFGVLFVNTSLEDALNATDRFHSLVEKPIFKVSGEFIKVNISGGIAGYPEDGEEADELMKQAQLALYKAKQTGRNKIISSREL